MFPTKQLSSLVPDRKVFNLRQTEQSCFKELFLLSSLVKVNIFLSLLIFFFHFLKSANPFSLLDSNMSSFFQISNVFFLCLSLLLRHWNISNMSNTLLNFSNKIRLIQSFILIVIWPPLVTRSFT